MRNLSKLTLILVFLLNFACQKNEEIENQNVSSTIEYEANDIIAISSLKNDNVYKIDNFSLTLEEVAELQGDILNNLKLTNPNFNVKTKIVETSLIKSYDGRYMLRTNFDNKYISTTLVGVSDAQKSKLGLASLPKATCTSTSCSSSGGCQPQMDNYCSPCTKGTKDCTRSSSN